MSDLPDRSHTHSTPGVALVTGAGSGIGRAVALALLRAGWQVALVGRRAERLDETAAADAAQPGAALRARVVVGDVTDEASVDRVFAATVAHFGRLDLLFNNAGVSAFSTSIEDVALADWQRVVDTNLTGMFLCTRAAFRQMKAQAPQGGRIINNGSISAHVPRPGSVAYTATKHGVAGLTKTASLDGRAYGIAVGQIDIGNAASDMTQAMQAGIRQADGSIKVEPVMDVQHVADTVVHMAGLPLSANVLFTTVMATAMPYVGRG